MSEAKIVFVTGSRGAVGLAVVSALKEEGYRVRTMARDGTVTAHHMVGDLRGLTLDQAEHWIDGCHAVIHCAAITDIDVPESEMHLVNAMATETLARAAGSKKVKRFVHISTGSIYSRKHGRLTEASAIGPRTAYERTKLDAEKRLIEATRSTDTQWTILRPTMIYGPGLKNMAGKLFSYVPALVRLRNGQWRNIEGGPTFNWVHAEDVARAAVFCMKTVETSGHAFNLGEDVPVPLTTVFNRVALALGATADQRTNLQIPELLLKFIANLVRRNPKVLLPFSLLLESSWRQILAATKCSSPLNARIEREVGHYMDENLHIDGTWISGLGFEYRHENILDSIDETTQWYVRNGWAPDLKAMIEATSKRSSLGFSFDEVMSGHWGDQRKHFQFSIHSTSNDLARFLRDGKLHSRGWIEADGIAERAQCSGTLWMPVRSPYVRIELEFRDASGTEYVYKAEKFLSLTHFIRDITTFIGWIEEKNTGRRIGNSEARFDLKKHALDLMRSVSFKNIEQE